MKQLLAWLESFAMGIGGPGLFAISALDSSFLSLPEINDILVVYMVTQRKYLMLYYVAMATAGSVFGCLILYVIARRGGERLLRKRVGSRRLQRGRALFQRYGVLAIVVPALLPPPAPFKLFVLLAGVAQMRMLTFALAVGLSRGLRYFVAGLLAVWYGDQAIEFIKQNSAPVALAVGLLVLGGGIVYFVWRARQRPPKLVQPSE